MNNGRKFFFGKYKGKFIKDIIVNDTQYITWQMKNNSWMWFNNEEVELYKKQILMGKRTTQYDIVMRQIENMKKE